MTPRVSLHHAALECTTLALLGTKSYAVCLSQVLPASTAQGLAHSRCSIDICRMRKWSLPLTLSPDLKCTRLTSYALYWIHLKICKLQTYQLIWRNRTDRLWHQLALSLMVQRCRDRSRDRAPSPRPARPRLTQRHVPCSPGGTVRLFQRWAFWARRGLNA